MKHLGILRGGDAPGMNAAFRAVTRAAISREIDALPCDLTIHRIARDASVRGFQARQSHGGYHAGDFPEDYELWLRWMDARSALFQRGETQVLCLATLAPTDEAQNLAGYHGSAEWEGHFGDMDFKLCGTNLGVTGFQLDLKLPGIQLEPMKEAIYRTRDARFRVLQVMNAALGAPRAELSPYAPWIETIRISSDKIGLIIGTGGKTIKGIVAETGAEINIEDNGSVRIYSNRYGSSALAWMTRDA